MSTIRDVSKLHPEFRSKYELLMNDVRAEQNSKTPNALTGIEFVTLETWRPRARQAELWAQGRKLVDGKWVVVNKAAIVTKAPPDSSHHEYGRAFDNVPKYVGKPFSWDYQNDKRLMAAMRRFADLAKARGIDWGLDLWGWDSPHFQDRISLAELRKRHPKGYQA